MTTVTTDIIRLYGIVQGVGFRPFVSRLADRLGVRGSVANKGALVEVHAQGTADALARFRTALEEEAPPRSAILKVDVTHAEAPPVDTFAIIESEKQTGDIFVSPDIATCELCRRELYDPHNRRYMHPFINCTACGPRLTILDSMPYDRVRTSMALFPMCSQCEYEYTHAETRRYDAQPVCCNDCGPEVYIIGRDVRGLPAITLARRTIIDGGIVAVKGIGGFHLCCNARNEDAVARLRRLKRRPAKPLAVMMRDTDTILRNCTATPEQLHVLQGHQKPIVILPRRGNSCLAPSIAPGNPTVGVMLPYAPVQMLLFDCNDAISGMTDALVMTSGNVSGAPICRSDEDATAEISSFCDIILSHNRKIRLRADDSVMDFFEHKPYMIRRSRGYAPLPFMLSAPFKGQVLGIGGELKNTFCPARDSLFYPSPYLGDMEDIRTVNALRESITRLNTLLEIQPKAVACDLHPKYNTAAVARELGLPVIPVQHHYAHILSCMAENDCLDEVLGVAFDGTGYGTDATIWGGELLRASLTGFTRLASITPFQQPGGDASVREGWRIAVSIIHALFPERATSIIRTLDLCSEPEMKAQFTMLKHNINTVTSTSAGRLFDATAAILGLRKQSSFEGEAAMALQFAAQNAPSSEPSHESTDDSSLIHTDNILRSIILARLDGTPPDILARQFHTELAATTADACRRARCDTGLNTVALSGGVCQNTLFTGLLANALRADGFRVLLHSLIPPNDGGICLGQALFAAATITPPLTASHSIS